MKIVFLILLLRSLGCGAFYACCDENNNLYELRACLDGKSFRIDCREFDKRGVNDLEIHYEIDNASDSVIYSGHPIPKGQYCYSRQNETKEEYFFICPPTPLVDVESTVINAIFQCVSLIFIVLTILVYFSVPDTQNLQEFITIHSISGLASSFLFLGYLQCVAWLGALFCHIVAYYLLYISFLYAFFWLNVLFFDIWKAVIKPKCLQKIHNWTVVYYIYGIGGPLTFLTILFVADNVDIPLLASVHPGIAKDKCWYRFIKETFIFFYGPISILLLSNIVYSVWTAIVLWNQSPETKKTRDFKYTLKLYLQLFFIMGITWVFEVVSAALDHNGTYFKFVWIVSNALNALEGIIIFLILVVFRSGVLTLLAQRTWCCGYITFPGNWRTQEGESDEEHEMENFTTQS